MQMIGILQDTLLPRDRDVVDGANVRAQLSHTDPTERISLLY